MDNNGEEVVVVVGNNTEVDGIQTDGSPVDAQIGSWVVGNCHKKHSDYGDLVMIDENDRYGTDYYHL